LGVFADSLVIPSDFAIFKGTQAACQTQQAGFANPIVTFEVQPLAGLEGEGNA